MHRTEQRKTDELEKIKIDKTLKLEFYKTPVLASYLVRDAHPLLTSSIELVETELAAPIEFAPKKNESLRFRVRYGKLDVVTKGSFSPSRDTCVHRLIRRGINNLHI